jgi:ABC-2 type transport system permease protein
MPIYDLSYRHWDGLRTSASMRWLPIASTSLMQHLKKRLFLFWLFICWVPALVGGVLIYVHTVFGVAELPGAANAGFFYSGYGLIKYFYLLTAVFVGAGLIANDRRTNALQIYLSKPIRTTDYLLGKGAAVAAAVGLVTLAPGLTLFLFRWGLDKEGQYLASNWMLPFSIVAASVLIMVTLSILSLTVSSLTKSGRTAGLMLVMLFLFSNALQFILGFFHRDLASLLSPVSNLQQGLGLVFGIPSSYRIHPLVSLVFLAGMLSVCLVVLYRRVRAVEVVK